MATTTPIPERTQAVFDPFENMAKAKPRRNRSWARAGTALAVALGCGALFVGLYSAAGGRRPVLAVSQAVAVGSTITASDLRVVRLNPDPGVDPISASDAAAVIGRPAAVGLVAGAVLVAADIASGPALPSGWAAVGLDLKVDQAPGNLLAGTSVMVVLTSAPGQPIVATTAPTILVGSAKVLALAPPSATSNDVVVTLGVPSESSAEVALAAAAGQVALVGLGPGAGS